MDEKIKIYIDGACRGNPGEGAVGFIVYDGNSKEVYREGKKIGPCTNNVAEYSALIESLKYIKKTNKRGAIKKIFIYSDSELMVKQVNGNYRVRNPGLKKLYNEVKKLITGFNETELILESVPREENKEADHLVNMILDDKFKN